MRESPEKELARREVLQQGIVICTNPDALEQCAEILFPVFLSLLEEIQESDLCFWYLYRQDKQPPHIAGFDGYSSAKVIDGRRVASVGLSVEALSAGADYAAMVFMHELSHVITGRGHDAVFHARLDRLILKYNRATGKRVRNDYQGLTPQTKGNVTP